MLDRKMLCIDLRWIDASGVGIYIKGILPEIVDRLPDVDIVGLGDRLRLQEFEWSYRPNFRILHCASARYSLREQVELPLKIPRKADMFFSPYYTIPLFHRGKIAVTVHDMSHCVVSEIVSNPKKRLYAKAMYRAIRKRASVVFTVSEFSKSEFLRLTDGPSSTNVVPTHLGISDEWYHASATPAIREHPYLICVGNVKPYKNLGRLVDAFLKIKHRIPHDLVIVGKSEGLITAESPEFFRRVRAAADRIHLAGFVDQERLLSLVGHADALVMPSLYEGFGLPPLEGMAAGIPVAVSRAASLPEVCGDAALYFDPLQVDEMAARLEMIVTATELRRQLCRKGLARAQQFSWSACARKTADALRAQLGTIGEVSSTSYQRTSEESSVLVRRAR